MHPMIIQTFFCSGNGFGPEGGGAVVDAMSSLTSLQELHIGLNFLFEFLTKKYYTLLESPSDM